MKPLVLESLFNKIAGLGLKRFKKRLQHKCFHEKFAKFFITPFFKEHFCWLFLQVIKLNIDQAQTCNGNV